MAKPVAILLPVLLAGFVQLSAQHTYEIKGNLPGAREGLKLYLEATTPVRKKMDSAEVRQGAFGFRGHMAENYRQVLIITANPQTDGLDYKSFWLEPGLVTVQGKEGKLRGSQVSGSSLQDIAAALQQDLTVYDQTEDSLGKIHGATKDTVLRAGLLKQIQAARLQRQHTEMEFVKTHPNSVYAAYILQVYASSWGRAKTAELYGGLTEENRNTWYGKSISDYLALVRDIKVGGDYADFEQTDKTGRLLKLSEVARGKYVLLEFWASWCGPCREENPMLVKTYETFKDKGFEIFAVSLDDNKTSWLEAIKNDKLSWLNVSDLKGDRNNAALMYSVTGVPTNYLIGKDGKIIAQNLRGQKLYDQLAGLLK